MRFIETMRRSPKQISAIVAVVAAVITIPAALLAFGPDRPTYTTAQPADHVTFNSITDNPAHGDERNFVQVKEASADNSTYAESANVQAGKQYTVFMYYHNNAASNLNASGKGIAKDVNVRAEIPAVVPKGGAATHANGYINASNASPKTVFDDISFNNTTGGDIALRYVPGSATIHNKGGANGAKLSDNIITSGAPIGHDSLNGDVPGCNDYAGYVTFNIVADQPNFEITKQVRKLGEDSSKWRETAAVTAGDKVEYLIHYKNTGTTQQNDVTIKDALPKGVTYVPGTTKIKNALNPSGKTASDNVVSTNGLNISNYTAGSDAYVWFTAQVDSKDKLVCGPNKLINKATVETNNGSKDDTADVTVEGDVCKPEVKKIEVCDLTTKKVITIDEKDFDSSKHSKNLADCKETPKVINVCELSTKKSVTIKESDFDASKHSKNFDDCKETPVTPEIPTELPETGIADAIAKIAGAISLTSATAYYLASRRI